MVQFIGVIVSMDWLKRIFEKRQDTDRNGIKHPPNVSSEFLQALRFYLAVLGDHEQELQQSLLSFIVDGTNGECLERLHNNESACRQLGYVVDFDGTNRVVETKQKRAKVVVADAAVSNEVWIRVGQLFAAANVGKTSVLGPADWPDWLANLLAEITSSSLRYRKGEKRPPVWSLSKLEEFVRIAKLPADALVVALFDLKYRQVFASDWHYGQFDPPEAFADLNVYCDRHAGAIVKFLKQTDSENRIHIVQFLKAIRYNGDPSIEEIVSIEQEIAESASSIESEPDVGDAQMPFEGENALDIGQLEYVEWLKSQHDPDLWHQAAQAELAFFSRADFIGWLIQQPAMDRATAGWLFLWTESQRYLKGKVDDFDLYPHWLPMLKALCERSEGIGFCDDNLGLEPEFEAHRLKCLEVVASGETSAGVVVPHAIIDRPFAAPKPSRYIIDDGLIYTVEQFRRLMHGG